MRIARVLALLVPLTAALLCVAPAPRAEAAQPEFGVFDDTFVDPVLSDLCGAEVEIHIFAQTITHTSIGRDNLRVTVTYTNLETGAQVETRSSNSSVVSADFEAGVLQFTTSRALRIVVPGSGAVHVAAGRTVETFVFDPETGDLISHELVEHGRTGDVDLIELLCELLTQ